MPTHITEDTPDYVDLTDGGATTQHTHPASGVAPAGADKQIQFNNAGVLDGDPSLIWDEIEAQLRLGEGFSDALVLDGDQQHIYVDGNNPLRLGNDAAGNDIFIGSPTDNSQQVQIRAGDSEIDMTANGAITFVYGPTSSLIELRSDGLGIGLVDDNVQDIGSLNTNFKDVWARKFASGDDLTLEAVDDVILSPGGDLMIGASPGVSATITPALFATRDVTITKGIVTNVAVAAVSLDAAGYATDAEVAAAIATHAGLADPHTGYRLESADHTHESTGLQGGKLDHGNALNGLTDDDHTQYLLASQATDRATFTANWTDLTDGGATVLHSHAGGSAHTIRENGSDQSQRGKLNFIDTDAGAGLITDDAGNDETEINLSLYQLEAMPVLVLYSPGSFTIPTENSVLRSRRVKLTGSQRITIAGTGCLRIS